MSLCCRRFRNSFAGIMLVARSFAGAIKHRRDLPRDLVGGHPDSLIDMGVALRHSARGLRSRTSTS